MVKLRTIILALLILIPISSALPQFPHKPFYCFNNCHGERGFSAGDNGGDDCGNCHTLYFNNQNFKEQHEVKTCPACHSVTDKDSYHLLHNTSCATCHIDNTIPDNIYSECLSCHVGGLHEAHVNKECSICHMVIIPQKIIVTEEIIKNATEAVNATKALNTSKTIVNYKKFTIYEIIINLYKQIIGDIYEI